MNNVFKRKSCDQKVNLEKYNNSLCILEKSEMGTSTNFSHTIGNISFCFLGGVANLSLITYPSRHFNVDSTLKQRHASTLK